MNITHYSDSFISILPPLVMVLLAIVTRRVLLSLGAGILMGTLLLSQGSAEGTIRYLLQLFRGIFWQSDEWNAWNINILLFLLLLGCLISLMTISGGTRAFADWAQQRIKSRRQAKVMTGLLVFLFFIDDYFHSLAVGTICRPVTDRFHISRAKLAYLLDSTAAPVCVLMPISSWGAYIIALIGGILAAHNVANLSAFSAFSAMIPLNFYALFTLLAVLVMVMSQGDVGAMARHEAAARSGVLFDASKGLPPGEAEALPVSSRGTVCDLLLPIVTLVLATVGCMVWSGAVQLQAAGEAFTLLKAFEHTDVGGSLVRGGAAALLCSMVLALRLRLPWRQWGQAFSHGSWAMWPAIRILLLAWAIAAVIRDLETGKYLASLLGAGIPVWLLPALLFVLAGAMAFSTGTSWGTFGIMLPLAADMVMVAEPGLLLPCLSAVLAGAVFGDHCSPISDTTILSSTGASCHHIDHVMTQLPYALFIAVASLLAYLLIGLSGSLLLAYAGAGLWFAAGTLLLWGWRARRTTCTA